MCSRGQGLLDNRTKVDDRLLANRPRRRLILMPTGGFKLENVRHGAVTRFRFRFSSNRRRLAVLDW